MKLYYNLTEQALVSEDNSRRITRPLLYLGGKPLWELQLFTGQTGHDGTAADLSAVVAWRAAVDYDWDAGTAPMCRTTTGIDAGRAALGILGIPLDANTTTYLAAMATAKRESLNGWFEVRGFDSTGAVVETIQFAITCRNSVDPLGGEPPAEPDSDLASKAWTRGYVAQPLIREYSADGETWHRELVPGVDLWDRLRHGETGEASEAQPILYGAAGAAAEIVGLELAVSDAIAEPDIKNVGTPTAAVIRFVFPRSWFPQAVAGHTHDNQDLLDNLGRDAEGKLLLNGRKVCGCTGGGTPDPEITDPIYYGYVPYEIAGETVKVAEVTLEMLLAAADTVTQMPPGTLAKTSIGVVPEGALVVVMIPAAAGLTAAKFNGIAGMAAFALNNGVNGTGANGAPVSLGGVDYLAFGEFKRNAAELFIYIVEG